MNAIADKATHCMQYPFTVSTGKKDWHFNICAISVGDFDVGWLLYDRACVNAKNWWNRLGFADVRD